MSSARKKVIVRRLLGDTLAGYLPPYGFVRPGASRVLDLLDLSGRVLPLPLADIKVVSFVRDFNLSDAVNPERLTRRTFLARPRNEGLWLRLTFPGGDLLEGLAPTDLSLLDGLLEDGGLFLIPPDTRSNTQRVFVPKTAIAELLLLAVITSPSRRKAGPGATSQPTLQDELFHIPLPPDSRPN